MGEVFMMGGASGGSDVEDANATTSQVLSGATFYSNENEGDSVLTGTMPNNGSLNPEELSAGDSYEIPSGYTDGGTVIAKSLAEQTVASADASKILEGSTAWVNGEIVTGEMANNGALNPSALSAGGSYTIPAGYTSGGTVDAETLASQTPGTATADQILSGQTAWVDGSKITGTMTNRGAVSGSISTSGGTYTIPAGYHNGSGKVTGATFTKAKSGSFSFTGGTITTTSSKNYGDYTCSINFGFTPTYVFIQFPDINANTSIFHNVRMCVSNINSTYCAESTGLQAQLINVSSSGCTLRITGFTENTVIAGSGTAYYVAC